jgi:hypothetical protein
MSISLQKIAEHKQSFQTEKMKVPVVLHINDALLPEEATLLQLESVASNDCCFHHIAGMADVHSKPGRKNATGTTVVSRSIFCPRSMTPTRPAGCARPYQSDRGQHHARGTQPALQGTRGQSPPPKIRRNLCALPCHRGYLPKRYTTAR